MNPTTMTRTVQSPLLLDGGMGHLLRRMGVEIKGTWGSQERFLGVALANIEQPHIVRDAHIAYIRAGAQVITTNNYAVVPGTLALSKGKYTSSDLEMLTVEAALRAREAVIHEEAATEGAKTNILVAGSLPPLAASFRADLVGLPEALEPEYEHIATALAPHVDLFLIETMSKASEAAAAARVASKFGKPVWVSWTLADPTTAAKESAVTLPSGETLEEAFGAISDLKNIEAFLVNCCDIRSARAALPLLQALAPADARVGAYANGMAVAFPTPAIKQKEETSCCDVAVPSGDTTKHCDKHHAHKYAHEYDSSLSPDAFAIEVASWVNAGATVVGGCCGIFPEHIQRLREALAELSPGSGAALAPPTV